MSPYLLDGISGALDEGADFPAQTRTNFEGESMNKLERWPWVAAGVAVVLVTSLALWDRVSWRTGRFRRVLAAEVVGLVPPGSPWAPFVDFPI